MKRVDETLWWLGYLLALFTFGALMSVTVQWLDLNVWLGTIVIMASISIAAVGFVRLFRPRLDK